MTRMATIHPRLLLALALGSCSDADEPDIRSYGDTGRLCLLPGGQQGTTLTVAFDNCLSCRQVHTEWCSATLIGDEITVSTALEVETRDTPTLCADYCEFAAATCELNVPTPGEYRVILRGTESAALTLPVTTPVAPYGDRECP